MGYGIEASQQPKVSRDSLPIYKAPLYFSIRKQGSESDLTNITGLGGGGTGLCTETFA